MKVHVHHIRRKLLTAELAGRRIDGEHFYYLTDLPARDG